MDPERKSRAMLSSVARAMKVAQVTSRKPLQGVWTVAADASVFEAVHMMDEHGVGALPVMDAGRVVGIVSERDCARRLILASKSPLTTPVREIMTDKLVTVTEDSTIEECMTLVTLHRVRHLPVMQG